MVLRYLPKVTVQCCQDFNAQLWCQSWSPRFAFFVAASFRFQPWGNLTKNVEDVMGKLVDALIEMLQTLQLESLILVGKLDIFNSQKWLNYWQTCDVAVWPFFVCVAENHPSQTVHINSRPTENTWVYRFHESSFAKCPYPNLSYQKRLFVEWHFLSLPTLANEYVCEIVTLEFRGNEQWK